MILILNDSQQINKPANVIAIWSNDINTHAPIKKVKMNANFRFDIQVLFG